MHDRWMLIVSLQTAGSVILDEQLVRLEQGWGVLVFPHQFHQYGEPDAQRLLWLFLTFELASGAALELLRNRPVRLAPAAGHTLETVLQAWEGAVGSGSHEAGVRLRLASALLLRQLLDAGDPAGRPAVPLATPDPGAAELVRRVTRYASEHLEEPLRVADLAEALAVSPSHLARRFRRAAGVSIGAYLRRYRLKRAAGYLAGSERTVSEAARHCGFDSIYAFSRAFKREFGVPPSRYRQALRRGSARSWWRALKSRRTAKSPRPMHPSATAAEIMHMMRIW
jgi:AraC-like DNA-binding protein